ncbi:linoleoyl-CoA desaturase [Christiangramia fulva]|uniref:Linoleoyl-CoA desaturase n=1 Tax=Christiangramia fulva TaxID=2126553 RepID=A0A2R3Z7P4_9FLAO|nr:acyl-CoA desaturase [Christiangramia fulva]AVR46248.1 linoleoyl-CoA desaturase [Christiangramia fulva]
MEEPTITKKPIYQRPKKASFRKLRSEVNRIVKNSPKRNQLKIKAVLFPLLYIAAYSILLIYGKNPLVFYSSYFLLGILLILIFLNLIHDAVHGVIFKKRWLNDFCVHFFDFLGANSYVWKIRHIKLHHTYPNIMNWDSDFEQSPLVRVFPQSEFKKFHKYQYIYLPFLYPLYLFNWLLVRDFKDFFKKDVLVRKVAEIPKKEYFKLFFFKAVFLGYLIFIPKFVLDLPWLNVISGFVVMVFTASFISLLVLLSPHANINSDFPQPDGKGKMPYNWMEHQLRCTNDISNDNFFIRFFMGSFNYHIAHHLFPDIAHVYYPQITPVIEKFAKENGLEYRKMSLLESLRGHYRLLKANAFNENIFEETM